MAREDLITDAKALVDRAELTFSWLPDATVVIGVRGNGAVSLFLGEEEVYHFNVDHQWRRGYWHGLLLKGESGRLVGMIRQRTDRETILARQELDDEQQAEHLARLTQRLDQLASSINSGEFTCLREVAKSEGGAVARFVSWQLQRPHPVQIADSPNTAPLK